MVRTTGKWVAWGFCSILMGVAASQASPATAAGGVRPPAPTGLRYGGCG